MKTEHRGYEVTYDVERAASFRTGDEHNYIDSTTATEVGRTLLAANEKAVGARYPDVAGRPDQMPGTTGQESANYKFKPVFTALTAVTILKACDCYDYQAGEDEDYSKTEAHAIISAIRARAIRRVPGYEDAPGWEYRRPSEMRRVG